MAELDWRSPEARHKALSRIEEAKRISAIGGSIVSAAEFEKQLFQSSKSKEDYHAKVNKVLLHLQQGQQPDVGQQGAVPNAVGMRPVAMQPRPGLTGFPNQGMMQRAGTLGPRGDIFGMPQPRSQLVGSNQMIVNSSMLQTNFPPMMQIKPQQQGIMQMGVNGGPGGITGPIPSPAGAHMPGSAGGAPMHSPGTVLSNASPGPHSIVPSPSNRASNGIPSPGNLHTPGNPGSVGSVGGGSAASMGAASKLSTAEEQAYLEKWKQLQKYIEPLKRMINRIDKDEDRKVDLNKMKNLLDILSDSSKRLPIQTLLKCEKVLEKQLQSQPTIAHPPASVPPLAASGSSDNMCQALLDAVAAHMKSPMLNHTLQRTFGPAVRALHGPPVSVDSPPPRKRKFEEADDGFEIDDLIQGEIARLHYRFVVNLDSNHQSGSKVIQLVCRLEDRNLPSVPQILITLPENYPHGSPTCHVKASDYEASPFLQKVRDVLTSEINRLTGCYSLTALLNLWDLCVRKACQSASS